MFPAGPIALLLAVAAAIVSPAGAAPAGGSGNGAAGAKAVVTDWRTGLALYGFDPVAYFADHQPVEGTAAYESTLAGGTWRFRNPGNLAAFKADAEAYTPRFGGYDPVALGRAVATAGNPFVWLVLAGRLYLFHDSAARGAFVADPKGALAAATEHWPSVRKALMEEQR